jgi:NAD(P)-dependent dehydrogenase (short-subunit alcohol dehydrogenase family)
MTAAQKLFDVSDKAVVVTGGSRGIGLMIAKGFVDGGARVYISARKAEACDAAAAELGPSCTSVPADLATPEGAARLAEFVAEREPALHVLVNNAGATWGAPLEEYPDTAFDKVFAINVKAVFNLTKLLLPRLRAAGALDPEDPARVINIGSIDGIKVPSMESYAYGSSKAAVHMLTRHLAHRLVDDNITVNAIAPGPFESKMMAFVLGSEEGRDMVASGVPLKRIGRPDDMAGAAIFLASRAGSYLTGAVIPVDGGISTKG